MKILNFKLKTALLLFIFISTILLYIYSDSFVYASSINKTKIYRPNNGLGLVGMWSFDGPDTLGGTIYDRSGQNNHANALAGYATTTFFTVGKIGQALNFDGVNDKVDIAGNPFGDTGVMTASLWVYSRTLNSGLVMLNSNDVPATFLGIGSANSRFYFSNNGGTTEADSADNSAIINTWQHVTVVRNASNQATFYVNGVLSGTANQAAGTPTGGSTRNYIGYAGSGGNLFFNGMLDDVRIYNRMLSATEIASLYDTGADSHINSSRNSRLTNGLIGLWSFDGADTLGGTIYDRSGQGNNGSAVSYATSTFFTTGKIGQALSFNGVNNYVTTNDINAMDSLAAFTVSAWVKFNSGALNQTIAGKYETSPNTGLFFQTGANAGLGDEITFGLSGSHFVTTDSANLSTEVWYHVVGTFNGSGTGRHKVYVNGVSQSLTNSGTPDSIASTGLSASNFEISRNSGLNRFLNGYIDDVRIYNRALSGTEVKALYSMGADSHVNSSRNNRLTQGLVGMWSFDGADTLGGSILDQSGQGNNANIVGSPATSTFYTIGKIGQAFNFDGVNDYVDAGDPASGILDFGTDINFTMSAWTRLSPLSTAQVIVSKLEENNPPPGYILSSDNFGAASFAANILLDSPSGVCQIRGTTDITDNTWHHVVAVTKRSASCTTSDILIYVDGVLEAESVILSSANTNMDISSTEPLRIGAEKDGGSVLRFAEGVIDDVRIYNRILSATEIKMLYNLGR